MKKYIALLRGINVGGHRKIKMDDLKAMFRSMGFENVATYIQSGNVVFEASQEEPDDLSSRISMQIDTTFGHDVPVLIRTPDELDAIMKALPFKQKEGWKGYISFLSGEPSSELKQKLESESSGIEKFRFRERELYSFIDKQTEEKPLFSNGFVEKKLTVIATSRNLRTVQNILDLADEKG